MVGDVELHHAAAQLARAVSVCVSHLHARSHRRRARGRRALAAFDLDQAQAARAERLRGCRWRTASGPVTPASIAARITDVPAGTVDRLAVDLERHRLRSPASRRRGAEVDLVDQVMMRPARSPAACGCAGTLEVFREVLERAQHRNGVSPPSAHSEPSVIVSHRSSSSTQVRVARPCPAMMRSITSTPRVEPMRQGVHLPQDSIGAELHREARHAAPCRRCRRTRRCRRGRASRRLRGERLVVERRVELRLGQVGAERAADLHRADRPARCACRRRSRRAARAA